MLNINIIKKIKISVLKVLTQIVCNQIIQIQQKYPFFGPTSKKNYRYGTVQSHMIVRKDIPFSSKLCAFSNL